MGAHFPSVLHFIFRFIIGTWNVFATKRNLCTSTRWSKRAKHSWWQMSLWPHMINKLAIQPQIKHNQATKPCQEHIKAFTHERAYMWHFSKHSYQPWIIHQDHQELSQTNHSIPNKLTKTYIVKPRIFIENPNPCTIAIVPGSVAIAYRTSHRMIHKVIHRIT
jgi:hypothetical protein